MDMKNFETHRFGGYQDAFLMPLSMPLDARVRKTIRDIRKCATGEDAAVPDAHEGAVSGQLEELEAVLLAQVAGKARVFAEGFVQISSQLVLRRQQPPMVVSDIRIFLRNISFL
ncbi:PREDICTED: NitaMp020 [Prunus dulcis]|uniref:PREDICTED: NitaMp020 n=1 Tax=Prunus dulcis TaxID=3755 RepID=A0A5E4G617_PRUDU|nr:PREDICTED: NitaMp020 [Prunus dulcis]